MKLHAVIALLVFAALLLTACGGGTPTPSGNQTAADGDTVKVHYRGTLEDGTVFDSSYERNEPLEFTLGQDQIIPGFEKAVIGMKPGDKKTVDLTPEEGYGAHREELIFDIPRDTFAEDDELEIGQAWTLFSDDGTVDVVIVDFDEETVTVDANHFLAGKMLTFEIELVEII